jgi:hypothetical protein
MCVVPPFSILKKRKEKKRDCCGPCCSPCHVFYCALPVVEELEGIEIHGFVVVVVLVIGTELKLVPAILVPVLL